CIHPHLPRSGDAPDQLNRVMRESSSERRPTSRKNAATAYSNVNSNCSAVAARSHGDHAPVSVKLGRNSGRNGRDDCENGRQSEGIRTVGKHRSPHFPRGLRGSSDLIIERVFLRKVVSGSLIPKRTQVIGRLQFSYVLLRRVAQRRLQFFQSSRAAKRVATETLIGVIWG